MSGPDPSNSPIGGRCGRVLIALRMPRNTALSTQPPFHELRRQLTLLDATMINVGVIIGSGIFFVPSSIAGQAGSTSVYFSVWLVGGLLSLFGALSIAELGAAMPRSGGQFVYLREAFGPVWGFLYGWTSFSVINSAAIAAIAVAFATYAAPFLQLEPWGIKLVAISCIALLTLCNCLGVKVGAMIQNGFTFAKVAAILLLVVLCFWGGSAANFQPIWPEAARSEWVGGLGLAMIAVLWSYDGWIEITYAAGEVKRPRKNLPRALLLSTVIVTLVYLAVNFAYVFLLSLEGMNGSERVAVDAAGVVWGSRGATAIAVAVLLSTFGASNGFILGAARIYYAMAREGLFFSRFGRVHPRRGTPVVSLIMQGVWSSILVLSGSFEQLFTYVVFAGWFFYAMTVLAVFVLRYKRPEMERPYRAWGYPVTPALFILFALWLVGDTIVADPRSAAVGVFLILSGLPAYFYWRRKQRRNAGIPS